jgi:Fe2+ transport system protein FeoA
MNVRWLDQVRDGEVVRMVGFVRCRRCGLRLTEMGLTPGTLIEVLQAARGQPLLLRVRGSQLAIDRETASKIEVKPLEGAPHDGGCHKNRRNRIRDRGGRSKRFGRHKTPPGYRPDRGLPESEA